jgi:hypothetical protein
LDLLGPWRIGGEKIRNKFKEKVTGKKRKKRRNEIRTSTTSRRPFCTASSYL